MRWGSVAAAVIFILACLIALGLVSDFLVDWLWFSAIGYVGVFWTIFRAGELLSGLAEVVRQARKCASGRF